jgi:hypothetical protein
MMPENTMRLAGRFNRLQSQCRSSPALTSLAAAANFTQRVTGREKKCPQGANPGGMLSTE